MMSSNSTSLGLVMIWGNYPSTSLVTSSQLVIPVSGKHLCCVWYCCANCQHFQLGKACSERKLPSLGRWTAITVVSQWINRRKPVAVWFCAARMAVSVVVNFLVHTHPNTWFLPWAMPSPGVLDVFLWDALCTPGCPFPLSCHQEPFTSPLLTCCRASSLPGQQSGSACLLSPPCLTLLLGTWEEAVSQD